MKNRRTGITLNAETHDWLSKEAEVSRYSQGRRAPHATDVLKIVALYCRAAGKTWEDFRSEMLASCPDPEPSPRDRRGLRLVPAVEA